MAVWNYKHSSVSSFCTAGEYHWSLLRWLPQNELKSWFTSCHMNTVTGEAKTVASDSMRSRDGHAMRDEDSDHRKSEIKLSVTGNKPFGYQKSVFFLHVRVHVYPWTARLSSSWFRGKCPPEHLQAIAVMLWINVTINVGRLLYKLYIGLHNNNSFCDTRIVLLRTWEK